MREECGSRHRGNDYDYRSSQESECGPEQTVNPTQPDSANYTSQQPAQQRHENRDAEGDEQKRDCISGVFAQSNVNQQRGKVIVLPPSYECTDNQTG
jgi:hypothetical protein